MYVLKEIPVNTSAELVGGDASRCVIPIRYFLSLVLLPLDRVMTFYLYEEERPKINRRIRLSISRSRIALSRRSHLTNFVFKGIKRRVPPLPALVKSIAALRTRPALQLLE